MTSDETFRYDPTPMNHAFPGQPDDCFDMVNQYGTYNIQKTADTDNPYPAIPGPSQSRPLRPPQQSDVRPDRESEKEKVTRRRGPKAPSSREP